MMQIQVLLLLTFSFIFTGCTTKEQIVFKDRLVCYEFQKVEQSEKVAIRVHKDDLGLFAARLGEYEENIKFYETQIDNYILDCKGK